MPLRGGRRSFGPAAIGRRYAGTTGVGGRCSRRGCLKIALGGQDQDGGGRDRAADCRDAGTVLRPSGLRSTHLPSSQRRPTQQRRRHDETGLNGSVVSPVAEWGARPSGAPRRRRRRCQQYVLGGVSGGSDLVGLERIGLDGNAQAAGQRRKLRRRALQPCDGPWWRRPRPRRAATHRRPRRPETARTGFLPSETAQRCRPGRRRSERCRRRQTARRRWRRW